MKNNNKGIVKQVPKKLTIGAVSAVMALAPVANNMMMVVHADDTPATYANGDNDYVFVARDQLTQSNSYGFNKNGATKNIDRTSPLMLLTDGINTAGSLVYNKPILASKGFSAAFQVEVGMQDRKVDGFTFMIARNSNYVGKPGPNLGYAGQGGQDSLAVEFDLFSNTNNSNNMIPHVALNRNGQLSSDYEVDEDLRYVDTDLIDTDGKKINMNVWVEYNPERNQLIVTLCDKNDRESRRAQTYRFNHIELSDDVYLGVTGSTFDTGSNPISSYIGVSSFYADNRYRSEGIEMNTKTIEDNTDPTAPIIDMDSYRYGTSGKEAAYYNVSGSTDESGSVTYMYKIHDDRTSDWKEVPQSMKYDPDHDLDFIAIDRVGNRSKVTQYKRPNINVTNGQLNYVTEKAENLAPGLEAVLTADVPENATFIEWKVTRANNDLLVFDKTNKVSNFTMPLTGNFNVKAVNQYNKPTVDQLPSGDNLVVGEYGIRLENAGLHKGWSYALMHEGKVVSRWITANGLEAITFGGSADERAKNDLMYDTDYQIAVKVPGDDKALESEVAVQDVKTAPGRIEAKRVIDRMITNVKGTVNRLPNLTQAQRDQYTADFAAADKEIKAAIDAAATQEAVDAAKDAGITKLTQMLDFMSGVNDENLTNARTNALKAIYDAKESAIKDINKLSNLTFEEKTAYKIAINSLYDEAISDVNSKTLVKEVEARRDAWLGEINTKLTDAKNVDATAFAKFKDAAIKELTDKATSAKASIDGLLNISQNDKTKAKANVDDTVAVATALIKKADTEFVITMMKSGALSAIDSIVEGAKTNDAKILADAKTSAVNEMKTAASDAITSIEALKNVDSTVVANAKASIQKTLDDGVANVNSDATNTTVKVNQFAVSVKEAITSVTNDVVNQDKTNLADAKTAANNELNIYLEEQINHITSLDNLSDDQENKAKEDVKAAITSALTAINTATSITDINKLVKDAKMSVENVLHDILNQDEENLITNRDAAKQAIATAVNNAKTTIGELSNLSPAKLKEAIAALDSAAKTANDTIDAATKTSQVNSAKNNGLLAIENIVNTYKVIDADNIQSWKQMTNAGFVVNADAAIKAIDALKNLSDTEKQTAKNAVTAKLNEGTAKVNAAVDLASILALKTVYENDMNVIRVNAVELDAKHLADAKASFNTNVDKKASNVRKAVYDLNNLTSYEKRAYASRAAAIVNDAKEAMADLNTITDVNALMNTTIKQLSALQAEAEKENQNLLSRTKAKASAAITKEEIAANSTIRNLENLTSIEMNEALKAVRDAASKGQHNVKNAHHISVVIDSRDDAIAAIKNVVSTTEALDAANLKEIKDHNTTSLEAKRASAKTDIAAMVNLTATEVKAAEAAIDAKVNAGIKAISDSKNRVEAAQATILTETELATIISDYKAIDAENLAAAKAAAYDDVDDAETQAKAKIDALRNILALDKLDFNKAIDDIITKGLKDLEDSTSITDVKAIVKAIINYVNKVAADAKAMDLANLNKAKEASTEVINDKAADIISAIDAMANLTATEKDALKATVNMIVKSGADKLNAKDIIVDVEIVQTATEEDLASVLKEAKETAADNLAAAKEEAKKVIAETADAVKKAIDDLAYLTQEQKDAFKAQIDEIIKDYAALIEAMDTVQAVTDYRDGIIKQLSNVKAAAVKANEDAKPAEKTEAKTGTEANASTVATGDTTNAMGSIGFVGAALGAVLALNKKRKNLK